MSKNGELTVIVVALLGGRALEACLQRLEAMLEEGGTQALVLRPFGEAGERIEDWRRDYPHVGFLDTGQDPVPLRRQRGAEACESEFVAFLEDTTWPSPGWRIAILAGFDDPKVAAVGGPVEISSALPARARALGVAEYGRFHPAVLGLATNSARPATRLPGNNLAYRRDCLLAALQQSAHGLIEGEVNDRLRARGLRLVLHRGMLATYAGQDLNGIRLSTRLQHGRLYGAGRSTGQPWTRRLTLCAKASLLPIVLSARALGSAARAMPPAKLPAVAIWICLMESAWALGEAIGYMAGEGRSLRSWR